MLVTWGCQCAIPVATWWHVFLHFSHVDLNIWFFSFIGLYTIKRPLLFTVWVVFDFLPAPCMSAGRLCLCGVPPLPGSHSFFCPERVWWCICYHHYSPHIFVSSTTTTLGPLFPTDNGHDQRLGGVRIIAFRINVCAITQKYCIYI